MLLKNAGVGVYQIVSAPFNSEYNGKIIFVSSPGKIYPIEEPHYDTIAGKRDKNGYLQGWSYNEITHGNTELEEITFAKYT